MSRCFQTHQNYDSEESEDETTVTLQDENTSLNPIARVLLIGVYDEGSPLSKLLGIPHVLQTIWRMVIHYWKSLIQRGKPHLGGMKERLYKPPGIEFFLRLSKPKPLKFPKPSNININMMPFVMEKEFDKCFLPFFPVQYGHVTKYQHR